MVLLLKLDRGVRGDVGVGVLLGEVRGVVLLEGWGEFGGVGNGGDGSLEVGSVVGETAWHEVGFDEIVLLGCVGFELLGELGFRGRVLGFVQGLGLLEVGRLLGELRGNLLE